MIAHHEETSWQLLGCAQDNDASDAIELFIPVHPYLEQHACNRAAVSMLMLVCCCYRCCSAVVAVLVLLRCCYHGAAVVPVLQCW